MADWFEETFGTCPHDGIKPYCSQCVGDELEAGWEEKREQNRREGRESELEATVKDQSVALDWAYAHIRALESRLRQPPPKKKRGRFGRAR